MREQESLVAAAWRVLEAEADRINAKAALQAALVALHEGGLPKCRVGTAAREELALQGLQPHQIQTLALSDASVRLVLDRVRSSDPGT